MRVDIANYFGSLNQHKLINALSDGGYQYFPDDILNDNWTVGRVKDGHDHQCRAQQLERRSHHGGQPAQGQRHHWPVEARR
ncbi:hypothetical protein [Roseateles asaccharophilus]|uniref:Uncharacterized protein n=1 Tax=Roseateles asaccharophilus TaxID=582607 RepID=A0ABU2ADX8_9BURK|nr:hypothetical protein [Roseateles asaccharophilus]MDR7335409.1 hypothetical protein [Roseateles asaccharophilus]